jgi:hypothetical protein
MKNNRTIEILLCSKYPLNGPGQKELADWLVTFVQPLIRMQQQLVKKVYLSSLKNSPPIHLS